MTRLDDKDMLFAVAVVGEQKWWDVNKSGNPLPSIFKHSLELVRGPNAEYAKTLASDNFRDKHSDLTKGCEMHVLGCLIQPVPNAGDRA